MQGIIKSFTTEEFGTLSLDITMAELIEKIAELNVTYTVDDKRNRVEVYTKDGECINVTIFSEGKDKILAVDFCERPFTSINIDGTDYTADEIKDLENVNRENYVWCTNSEKYVRLDKNYNCIERCGISTERAKCWCGGCFEHVIKFEKSIIGYINTEKDGEHDEYAAEDLFYIHNNDGKPVNMRD